MNFIMSSIYFLFCFVFVCLGALADTPNISNGTKSVAKDKCTLDVIHDRRLKRPAKPVNLISKVLVMQFGLVELRRGDVLSCKYRPVKRQMSLSLRGTI